MYLLSILSISAGCAGLNFALLCLEFWRKGGGEGRVLNIFIINYEPTNLTANTRPLRQVFPWLIEFITSLVFG